MSSFRIRQKACKEEGSSAKFKEATTISSLGFKLAKRKDMETEPDASPSSVPGVRLINYTFMQSFRHAHMVETSSTRHDEIFFDDFLSTVGLETD